MFEINNYRKVNTTKKVFVGNVPFQCTKIEFIDCFKNMKGFITADIKRRHKSKLSRGFGFVVFDSKENANSLLTKTNIMLKNRTLRFSPYSLDKYKSDITYSVFIDNLKEDETEENLIEIMEQFGTVINCKIYKFQNINKKKCATITYKKFNSYYKSLNDKIIYNNEFLSVKPYKKNKHEKTKHFSDHIIAYNEGFNAGKIIGFQEGFLEGLKKIN